MESMHTSHYMNINIYWFVQIIKWCTITFGVFISAESNVTLKHKLIVSFLKVCEHTICSVLVNNAKLWLLYWSIYKMLALWCVVLHKKCNYGRLSFVFLSTVLLSGLYPCCQHDSLGWKIYKYRWYSTFKSQEKYISHII